MKNATRYSDSELQEFRELVQGRIEKTEKEFQSLKDQIAELEESMGDDRSDMMDSTNSHTEGEMLFRMAGRTQR
ncbi:MAG: hypothetical protein HKN16_03995, partial [Saprospiraceae bacterium]|nr:hypothetical protein [Saprospiraceae bacterium]